MVFLQECVQSFILSLENYEVVEGDTIFPQDNGTLFQNLYNPFTKTFFLKYYGFPFVQKAFALGSTLCKNDGNDRLTYVLYVVSIFGHCF